MKSAASLAVVIRVKLLHEALAHLPLANLSGFREM